MNTAKQAGWLFLIVLILYLISSFLLPAYTGTEDLLQLYALNALVVSILCMYAPALFFMQKHPDRAYGRNRINFSQIALSVLLGISAFLLSTGIGGFVSLASDALGLQELTIPLPRLQGWRAPAAIVVICIIPAITEEQLFRGVLINEWRQMGRRRAIWLTSVLFALMHGNPVAIPSILALGYLLGALSYDTGSVYPSMTVHLTNNFISLFLGSLLSQMDETAAVTSVDTGEILMSSALYTGMGLLFTIVNYKRLMRLFKQSEQKQPKDKVQESSPRSAPPEDKPSQKMGLMLPVGISLVLLIAMVTLYLFVMMGIIAL